MDFPWILSIFQVFPGENWDLPGPILRRQLVRLRFAVHRGPGSRPAGLQGRDLVEPMEPWEAMGSPGYSMTDPWCCHIVGDMDPINIPPLC